MLDYISVPHVFIMFVYHFGMIYGTKLLTRCPVAVSIFCCIFVSEKLFGEVSRNQLKIYMNYFHKGKHLGPTWRPPTSSRVALSPSNWLRCENPRYPIIFSRKHPRPPPSSTLDREGSEVLPGTLPEGGIITGGIYITMPAFGVMRE